MGDRLVGGSGMLRLFDGIGDVWFFNYGTTRMGFNNNYSEIFGIWTDAENNLDVDPQFVLPGYWDDNGTSEDPSDDFWVAGDYHLNQTSDCIDAGYALAPKLPSTDFEGDPRLVDGDNDGVALPDIGADEYTSACRFNVKPDRDVDGSDLAVTIMGGGVIDTAALASELDRNNCP